MERANEAKNAILAGFAFIASVSAEYLGGWDAAVQTLVMFMAVDYLTGLLVASIFKRSNKSENGSLDSRAGFKGLVRKGVILLVVLVGAQLDAVIGTTGLIRNTTIFFFLGNEGLSIVENVGLMGVPMPEKMKDALEALRDKGKSEQDHRE